MPNFDDSGITLEEALERMTRSVREIRNTMDENKKEILDDKYKYYLKEFPLKE